MKFVAKNSLTPLANIDIPDKRFERVLFAVLDAHKAFVWDKDADHYEVDLSIANPPHLVDEPRPEGWVQAAVAQHNHTALTANPKWRGNATDTGYTSKAGWVLDYVEERPAGLKKGERGKHWRLTHVDGASELWFKSKKEATNAILDGSASKAVFK